MVTGQHPPVFTPEDLRKNFERLQTDLNVIQNELDQALGVWRSILDGEKQEFKQLMEAREKDWAREDVQWEKDQEGYRQKIDELETYFKNQLTVTEKNAVRALNELDAAWQQERLRWQETQAQHSKETQQSENLQNVSQQELEQRVAQLTEENVQLLARVEQTAPLETQLAEWQAEKAAWQQSLSEQLEQQRQTEEIWLSEQHQKDTLIQTLQQQLAATQEQLQSTDQTQKNQEQHVHVYMNTLETQVTALEEFVQQVFTPRRRRSDPSLLPPAPYRPPSSRAGH